MFGFMGTLMSASEGGASSITTNIGKITPAITQGFSDIVTGCIDLAIALVPLALGYLAVLMVIKKGKQLMKM